MTHSVSQVAERLGRSNNTIRNRGRRFARFLSPGANPQGDQPRQYIDDDVAVLETIEALHQQQMTFDEIEECLEAGERIEIAEPPLDGEPKEQTVDPGFDIALLTKSFDAALQQYEKQIADLLDRLDEANKKRLDAEKRAAVAETELRNMLRERHYRKRKKSPWWRFWRG